MPTIYRLPGATFQQATVAAYTPFASPSLTITSVSQTAPDTITVSGTDGNSTVSSTGYGYELQRSSDGGQWISVFRTTTPLQANFSFADVFPAPGVIRNRTYAYRIRAFNTFEDGEFSATQSLAVASTLSAASLGAITQSPRTLHLSWTSSNPATPGVSIEVYKNVGGTGFGLLTRLESGATAYDDVFGFLSLEATTYDYRLRYVYDSGIDDGPFSNTQTFSVGFDLAAVTLASPTRTAADTIHLAWTDTNLVASEEGLDVERAVGLSGVFRKVATVVPGTLAFDDVFSVEAGQTYRYRVRPFNEAQHGPYSNVGQITADLLAPAISSLAQTADTGVRVTWTSANTLAAQTEVQRDDGAGFSTVATVASGTLTIDDQFQAAVGTIHTYRVRDTNPQTSGPYSATRQIQLATTLIAPSGGKATFIRENLVRLAWTDGNTGHRNTVLERSVDGGAFSTLATLPKGVTTHDDTSATSPGQVYTYRLHDTNNQESGPLSSEFSAAAALLAPTNFRVTAVAGTSVSLAWDDANTLHSGTQIERAQGTGAFSLVGSVAAGVTTFTDTVPNIPGQSFSYRARDFRSTTQLGQVFGAYSAQATTAVALIAPTSAAVIRRDAFTLSLTWADTSNTQQSGYRVLKRVDSGSFILVAEIADPSSRLHNDSGDIAVGRTYSYKVVAFNQFTQSPESNTASILVRFNAPATVAIQVSRSSASVTVTMPSGFTPVGGDQVRLTRVVGGGQSTTFGTAAAAPTVTFTDATLGSLAIGTQVAYSAQLFSAQESGPFSATSSQIVRDVFSLAAAPYHPSAIEEPGWRISSEGGVTGSYHIISAAPWLQAARELPTPFSVVSASAYGPVGADTASVYADNSYVLATLGTTVKSFDRGMLALIDQTDVTTPAVYNRLGFLSGSPSPVQVSNIVSDGIRAFLVYGQGGPVASVRLVKLIEPNLSGTTDSFGVAVPFFSRQRIALASSSVLIAVGNVIRQHSYASLNFVKEIAVPGIGNESIVDMRANTVTGTSLALATQTKVYFYNFGFDPPAVVSLSILDAVPGAGSIVALDFARGGNQVAVLTADNRVLVFVTQILFSGAPTISFQIGARLENTLRRPAFQDNGSFGQHLHVTTDTVKVFRFTQPYTSDQFISA